MTPDREQIIDQRLLEFRQAKVMHAVLHEVLEDVVFYILRSPGTDVINIVGPTGVGKSMLIGRLEVEMIKASSRAMADNRNMRPFVSSVAVASGHRGFDFKRLYASVLSVLGDPFANFPASMGGPAVEAGSAHSSRWRKVASTAAMRERLERELELRGTVVWCLDEAQHAVFGGKSGPPKHQLDVFKSIAQRGSTKLCLIGPPELEDHLLSSGQLARRSMTIHFRRYRHQNAEDLLQFASVAEKFFQLMNFSSTPDVTDNLDFIYSGSLGCVGIMKDWFERAMAVAMSRHDDLNAVTLTIDHLRETRMPASALASIQSEILRMERSIESNETDDLHERIVHGDGPAPISMPATTRLRAYGVKAAVPPEGATAAKRPKIASSVRALPGEGAPTAKRAKARPGQRNPGRDPVGGSDIWGGNDSEEQ